MNIDNVKNRFFQKISKTETCWNWTASKTTFGYGVFRVGSLKDQSRRIERAHRMSWILHKGEIPSGLFVLHTCDNPGCVNPSHLFLGKDKDNMMDKEIKKRGNHPVGERIGTSKYTESLILQLRHQYDVNKLTIAQISKKFNMDRSTINRIVHRKRWAHI